MTAVHSQLEAQIDDYFGLEEIGDVAAWAEKTFFIPFGEKRGFVDFDETPWAREPINSLVDPDVIIEAGVYGTQLAKTTQATIVAAATVAKLRQHFVWMWPKADAGRSFSTGRFQPIIEASPELRALKPDNHDLYKNLELHFKGGGIGYFVGSHSKIDQKSKPAAVAIADEIEDIAAADEKETDPITSLKERSKTFTDRKMFLFGSCLLETGPAWAQYLLGDRRHFLLPCPDCSTRQALEFRGPVWLINRHTGELEHRGRAGEFRLWWDPAARQGEHDWDYDAVRATVCYVCPECGAKIRDGHKRSMLRAARWHPTAKAKTYGTRSRRINSLYAMWAATSFAGFAIEFLDSLTSTKKLQNFTNNWEAKPWVTGLDLADKDALQKRIAYLATDSAQGQRVGAHTIIIVDVQRAHLVWGHLGFDDSGAVHLIDCGYTPTFDTLREIDDALVPDFVAIDTRHRAQEVYTAVHQRRARWIALRGEATGAPLTPKYDFDPFTGDRAGRQGLFVITLVHLNTYAWGEEFLNRIYPAKAEAGALPPALPGVAAAAANADLEVPRIRDFFVFATFGRHGDFVRQLFSEYIIEYTDARGRPRRRWKEAANNHLFDICKYAYAIGSFLGFTRIAAETRKAVAAATAAAAAKQPELPLAAPTGGTPLFPPAQ